MKEKFSIDDMYRAQFDTWEKLLITVLHAQSDSMRSGLRSIQEKQTVGIFNNQLFEYSHRQLENWVAMEKGFLHTYIQWIKVIDPVRGYTAESGKETADRFIDHWGNRAGKVLEAHTDFYSLIFPWNDGEVESSDTKESRIQKEKGSTEETIATAA